MSDNHDKPSKSSELDVRRVAKEILRLPPDQAERVIAEILAERTPPLALTAAVVEAEDGAVAQGHSNVAAGTGGIAAGRDLFIARSEPYQAGPSESSLLRSYFYHVFQETGFLDLTGVDPALVNSKTIPLRLHAVYTALLTLTPLDRSEPTEPEIDPRMVSALEHLNRHKHVALVGDPGSGKSTFVNFVALCMAGEALDNKWANLRLLTQPLPKDDGSVGEALQPWEHGCLFPVRIVLRDFATRGLQGRRHASADDLWKFLQLELKRWGLPEVYPILRSKLIAGQGLVLLDGLDEAPEAERRRQHICKVIENFSASLGGSRVLLTSRSYAYQNREWQVTGFEQVTLAPFSLGQIYRFVNLWYEQMASQGRLGRADALIRAELLRQAISVSDRLLELARRPLLLTLMASLHAWKGGNLPERREELYAEAVELLLNTWERRRIDLEDASNPAVMESIAEWLRVDRQEVRHVLEKVAFEAHNAQPSLVDTADVEEGQLVSHLLHLSRNPGADAVKLVAYLRDRAGLLVERGEGVYTFPHRTFQEYLAACHLTSLNFPKVAARLVREDPGRWREVVLLAGAKAARGAVSSVWHLADVLCFREADSPGTGPADEWGALLAGQVLAESSNKGQVDEEDLPKLQRVQKWLVRLMRSNNFPVRERTSAGRALSSLGDLRFDTNRWCLPAESFLGFVEVPAGPFLMGSDSELDASALGREMPQHEVTLSRFWIARYPVTVDQFRNFLETSAYVPKDSRCLEGSLNHPVGFVTWDDAMAYCRWLGEQLRLIAAEQDNASPFWSSIADGAVQLTLPSEAEWEKAARGTDARIYPWGNKVDPNRANFDETGLFATSSVGAFPGGVSPYGCEDMCGNVWEWTRSLWGKDPAKPDFNYRKVPGNMLTSTESVYLRIVRGGAYSFNSVRIRCAFRSRPSPDDLYDDVGFRVALSPFGDAVIARVEPRVVP